MIYLIMNQVGEVVPVQKRVVGGYRNAATSTADMVRDKNRYGEWD